MKNTSQQPLKRKTGAIDRSGNFQVQFVKFLLATFFTCCCVFCVDVKELHYLIRQDVSQAFCLPRNRIVCHILSLLEK